VLTLPEVAQSRALRSGIVAVAGIFGANASGKTNVIDALRFFRQAVLSSQLRWGPGAPIPVRPFRLAPDSQRQPSSYQLDFVLGGQQLQYGFSVTSEAVQSEWLFAWPAGKRQTWFERSGPTEVEFGRALKGPNQAILRLTRPNSLFLSAAAQNNHAMLSPVQKFIERQILLVSDSDEVARAAFTMDLFGKADAVAGKITELVRHADLGILDLSVKQETEPVPEPTRLFAGDLLRRAGAPDNVIAALPTQAEIRRLVLRHAAPDLPEGIPMEVLDESRGTLAWFALAGPMIQALATGALLVVDELNASLHELLQAELVRRFNSPEHNQKGAQLLFNTQDSTLLGDMLGPAPILRRDQVWFCDKRRDGQSTLTPLTDFRVRKGENLQRRYLEGRFRAVPYLDELAQLRLELEPRLKTGVAPEPRAAEPHREVKRGTH
jgi:hypothetical protein